MVNLKVKKLHPDAIIPTRGTTRSSGLDLYALEDCLLVVGTQSLIKTGIAFEIPEGYEIQIRPRSGMSLKTKFRVANAPGSVDQDFLGEICVIGWNAGVKTDNGVGWHNDLPIFIKKGDRIAQAVLCPVIIPNLIEVDDFEENTERGDKGFGSTGV